MVEIVGWMMGGRGGGILGGILGGVLVVVVVGAPVWGEQYMPSSGSGTKVATGVSGSGYTHAEGPIYDGNGGILFCELNSGHTNDLIWRYDIGTGTRSASPVVGDSGGTQGMYGKDAGHLVTADRDTRQISVRPYANLTSATAVATTFGGKQFYGPNDLVVDGLGGIYFTDPNFESRSGPGADAVYYITASGTVNQILTYGTTGRPNGIILSPNQDKLYVGLWNNNVVNVYDINAAGVPTNGHALATIAHPDGMMIDAWGNLIVTRTGGVTCLSSAGSTLWNVSTADSNASNVEIYNNTLYITAGISLYSVGLTPPAPEPGSLWLLMAVAPALLRRRRRG